MTTLTSSPGGAPWWRDAVVYQVYVRSFADGLGADGIGDLPGITSRLPYLCDLGVDALWITPFYTSPQKDHGYDVADYRDVDPRFGTLADIDTLLETAHGLGLRVIVDLVPNHTSDAHVWFQAALAAEPGSPERARYLFRDGRGPEGSEPPNNWQSVFGGPAWTRVPDGQWYLHLFDSSQPDLDWRNPEVGDEFDSVLRFWLDRGVDGFRVDVAHGLYKEESLRDQERPAADEEPGAPGGPDPEGHSMVERVLRDEPMWEQPEVHDVYRRWRTVLAEYPGDRMAVAEAWTQTPESMAEFIRSDELHQAFNFAWLSAHWSAESFADVINESIEAVAVAEAAPTWVLSNHDVERHPTRYGGGPVGLARARAATLAMLALPGSAYLYQGEELGLEQVDVPPEARQDPSWFRTGEPGRDGCRVPIPWAGSAPPYGFGDGAGQPWIPQPEDWAPLSVEAQLADEDSTLSFYRRALAARRKLLAGADDDTTATATDHVLEVRRGGLRVLLNAGTAPVPLGDGELLISSGPCPDNMLPPHTAVWLR
ncbi:glycoside hydrolase family 13 protein [Nocardioides sp. zg-ZUI104]|uniref:glycoside hydrolase family 13 protein n=1 Tax=Nocardioides faecalis TaxID=2803858 RepID=UPI001BCAB101|nr:alpha-amylase family glycosyl hydrolase [Nocardioides faecalis]MBS4751871.1 glycoside hydrolase family 13 protein [Nocardioides faecalis]